MRIGIVSPFNPYFVKDYLSGDNIPNMHNHANAVNTLVLAFLQGGHEITVFTTSMEADNVKVLKGERICIYIIPYSLYPKRPSFLKSIPHSNTLMLNQFYVPKRISKIIANNLDSLDVLHAHWTYEYAMACQPFKKIIPVFTTVRDWAPKIKKLQTSYLGKLEWFIKLRVFKKVITDKDIYFIANSHYTYNKIISTYPNTSVNIIPNPIKKELVLKEKIDSRISKKFVSICQNVGNPGKNIRPMLEAFKLFKEKNLDSQLDLVGVYEINSVYYQQWERDNLLNGVVFHGKMPHHEMMKLLDNASCLVHPSLEESFGNVLLEAMSRCVLCIGGKDSGAVPDILGNGKYGLVCDVLDYKSILDAMEKSEITAIKENILKDATAMLFDNYVSDIVALKHIALFDSKIKEMR